MADTTNEKLPKPKELSKYEDPDITDNASKNSSRGGFFNDGSAGDAKSELPSLFDRFVSSFQDTLPTLDSDERRRQKLSSLTINGLADFIRDEGVRNIIVMVGAGISTAAGIPDFRSPGTGLYDNLGQYNLPDPLAIFDLTFFLKNPEPFFTVARDLFPADIKPTLSHYFIRLLDEKGLLRRCFTQNIDSLEFVAGVNPEKIVTAHGSHQTNTCLQCKKKYKLSWMNAKLAQKECKVPYCDDCKAVVKPDIVFFGENLPRRFFNCSLSDFNKCDLLIIMGTSLVVQPFASLIHEVAEDVPRLLINLSEAGKVRAYEKVLGLPGLRFGEKDNYRDVFWKGTCDDGVLLLAELLGWKSELLALKKNQWSELDRKKNEVAKDAA